MFFGMIYPVEHVQEKPRVEVIIDRVPKPRKLTQR
jgi:hypothetical protein